MSAATIAHLAIAFCRCLNIPARYCTGYISDIGLPLPHAPGDFGAWIECFLGGRWHLFDPRNNNPRIGRILVAHGRDASDVPLTLAFGVNTLVDFRVVTDEIVERRNNAVAPGTVRRGRRISLDFARFKGAACCTIETLKRSASPQTF